MNSRFFLRSVVLAAGPLLVAAPVIAQHDHHGSGPKTDASSQNAQLIRVTDQDASWAAAERAKYPLTTCVVSGEELGSMGKAPEYIYRVKGRPDRLVVFCCSGCDEDFLKNPAAHLAKIEAGQSKAAGKARSGHAGHH